jgi:hypothetical protein
MAFSYYSPYTINSGQVPSTQTDFPVLVRVTDNRFKTVGNGGHVQNSSGYDIRPYTDSTLSTAITGYELEFYDGTNGIVAMWVKVSSLSSSTTPFVLACGNSSLTTDGSSTTTWSNSFLGVYHLANGTTLNVNSATGSNNGTNHSATATTGQIDGGAAFVSASSQYIDLGTAMQPTAVTVSAWIKGTTFPSAYNSVVDRVFSNVDYWIYYVKSSGKMSYQVARSGTFFITVDGTGSNTLSTGTWYYTAMTFDNTLTTAALKGYVNGSLDASGNVGVAFSLNNTAGPVYIGNTPTGVTAGFWNGAQDEVRVASGARSANWITTEYNNQSAPGTFATLGTEVALGGARQSNFLMFF